MGQYAQEYNRKMQSRQRAGRVTLLTVITLLFFGLSTWVSISLENGTLLKELGLEGESAPSQGTYEENFTLSSTTQTTLTEYEYEEMTESDIPLDMMDDAPPVVSLTDAEKEQLPEVLPILADVIVEPNYQSDHYIVVYVGTQCVVVYGKNEEGQYAVEEKVFICSTGTEQNPTEPGLYTIFKKQRWGMLMGSPEDGIDNYWGQYCSSIGNGYLFHSVPYRAKAADMMTMNMYNNLGKRASHGCIRMTTADCKWIFDNCAYGTQVHVTMKEGPTAATPPPLNYTGKYWGFDPTDKWTKENPYYGGIGNTTTDPNATTTTVSTTASTESTQSTTSATTTSTATSASETTTTSTTTTTTTTTTEATTTTTTAAPSDNTDAGSGTE